MEFARIAQELQPRSIAARDWVFQVIRTAIIRGVLPGGMPLRQDEISTTLPQPRRGGNKAVRKRACERYGYAHNA